MLFAAKKNCRTSTAKVREQTRSCRKKHNLQLQQKLFNYLIKNAILKKNQAEQELMERIIEKLLLGNGLQRVWNITYVVTPVY